jgi:GNAT superfamily N-acetyltransferase
MATVQRVSPAAWERLREVRLRALQDSPDAYGSTYERESSMSDDEWRAQITRGPWWIAAHATNDVGLVAGGRHRVTATPWVFSMWVDEGHRGTGVAEELLSAVATWATDEGATELGLDVADRAPRARRFYERMGFQPNGHVFAMPRDESILLIELTLVLRGVGLTSPSGV